jgi:hypothetical protein
VEPALHDAALPDTTVPDPSEPYCQQYDVEPLVPQYAVAVDVGRSGQRNPQHVDDWLQEPPVYAWQAACASVWLCVLTGLQS